MLLPGTFLGVWNLIAITGAHSAARISQARIQAHGHAQLFGWIGSFILGIGFYSLSKKMGQAPHRAAARAWVSWWLWVAGVSLRWCGAVYAWNWRLLLPLSAALELAGFCIFFDTVRKHRPEAPGARPQSGRLPMWIGVVIASTIGFLASLTANLGFAIWLAANGSGPAVPLIVDQHLLALFLWGFIVPAIWGFSSRWLPVFLGLGKPRQRMLLSAVPAAVAAVAAAWWGLPLLFALIATLASIASVLGLRVFGKPFQAPELGGAHKSLPAFVRLAYAWLLVAAGLSLWAAGFDRAGGIWGASRHALTVGFVSTMVFSIGQRILPAFSGMRPLLSQKLMFLSLLLLNAGCLLRVASEIPAYESWLPGIWPFLPVSAVIEMTAFTIFAANLLLTFRSPRETST